MPIQMYESGEMLSRPNLSRSTFTGPRKMAGLILNKTRVKVKRVKSCKVEQEGNWDKLQVSKQGYTRHGNWKELSRG